MGLRRTYIYQNEQFTAIPSPSVDSRAVSVTPALVDKDDKDREQMREVCDTVQSRVSIFKNFLTLNFSCEQRWNAST